MRQLYRLPEFLWPSNVSGVLRSAVPGSRFLLLLTATGRRGQREHHRHCPTLAPFRSPLGSPSAPQPRT
jgi:hypothetical protein